jgi:hypothetical protein
LDFYEKGKNIKRFLDSFISSNRVIYQQVSIKRVFPKINNQRYNSYLNEKVGLRGRKKMNYSNG